MGVEESSRSKHPVDNADTVDVVVESRSAASKN